jgi:hypothetical protein
VPTRAGDSAHETQFRYKPTSPCRVLDAAAANHHHKYDFVQGTSVGMAEVTVVKTSAEFDAALSSGARHIEIHEHLNFAGWPATQVSPTQESVEAILSVQQTTLSIRVCPKHSASTTLDLLRFAGCSNRH